MKPADRARTYVTARLWMVLVSFVLGAFTAVDAHAQWPQWGGPQRDFKSEASGLADTWPAAGPTRVWHRELGEGYSGLIVDGDTLFTMYRRGSDEYTIALNAHDGATLWEYGIPSPTTEEMDYYGPGPHATPLVVGSYVYSAGANADLHCFDRLTGKVIWHHALLSEYARTIPAYGHTCSPLAYKNLIITSVIGQNEPEQILAAFDAQTGALVWENRSLRRERSLHADYSSPIIIEFQGQPQLVFFTNEQLAGLNPDTGELLWQHPTPGQNGVNISTPVFDGKDILFCSGAYSSGARAVRLTKASGRTVPDELWYTPKMRVHHGNVVLLGKHVYGSTGDFGAAFFACLELETGKLAWRARGFSKANSVWADGRLILLDEDGQLALTTVDPKGLAVHSKCQVTERVSWTGPTLVGKTLYLRDRRHLTAMDVG